MTDPTATDPVPSPSGSTAVPDTAALLDAGIAPTRASGRWTPPAPEALTGLPNLEVFALIGAGGMGAVYRARQTHLDRIVALKLLAPERAAAPGFAERFAREARAMARLDHPHIVRLHDFGRAGDWHYLVMEHVDGATLRQVLATGKLSAAEALRIIPQLCDALAHAHAAGVVHRDLKPENILVDGQGRARIADFGLAKLAETADDRESLTGTGDVLGTAHYMAPEQIAGKDDVDHRADLYALGVVAYEMLTGALPVGRFEPPSRASGVGPGIDEVVLKSLERDPQRRYRDAAELRAALDRAEKPQPQPQPGAPPPPAPTSGERVKVGPIEVDGDHVRVGSQIEVKPGRVRVGPIEVGGGKDDDTPGIRYRSTSPGREATVEVKLGSKDLHNAGMTAVLGGSALGLWLASQDLGGLLANPAAHFAAHRAEDLALFAAPAIIVGGIALLSRTLIAAAIASTIAATLVVPWALAQHWLLLGVVLVAVIWYVTTLYDFPKLRDHMGSLPRAERVPRLLLMVPLFAIALGAPAVALLLRT
jgi:hypothetical protein